ncbi:MAG: zinc-binding dehydrogenase, partial [Fimbriimonas ginsengisoli]|nr:zinc-binding dehydrogenase [Fimbriimonas ginsengisoli]
GAAGGVGGFAVALLAATGFRVAASTGRAELAPYLESLGASEIVPRAYLSAPGKPLDKERWSGVVDTVGGDVLGGALRGAAHRSVVAACGMAGGAELKGTVFPLILRGVRLQGIDTVLAAQEREAAWKLLAQKMPRAAMDAVAAEEIGLDEVVDASRRLLAGKVRGRIVVRISEGRADAESPRA